jgi:flagellar biosynthetic protein FliO
LFFGVLWIALVTQFAFSQTADTAESAPVEAEAAASAGSEAALSENGAAPVSRAEEEFLFSFDDDEAPAGTAAAAGPSPVFAIFRMILVLALVAGLIYLVVFFLRRFSRPQAEQNPHLKILATTHLGGGRFIHVVSVGKNAWLVGAGEGGINRIADIADQEAVDAMLLDASRKSAEENVNPISTFQALLKRFSAPSVPPEDRLENLRKRRERFKRF